MPFARGRSGNAAGRPLGAVNKLTREGRRIAGKEGSTIIKKIAENGRNGDAHAQRLFMTFLYPRVQFIDSQVERAPLATVQEAAERVADTVARMEKGEIGIDEAQALIVAGAGFASARSVSELEKRLDGVLTELAALKAEISRLTRQESPLRNGAGATKRLH